jgi:hypothetical protein
MTQEMQDAEAIYAYCLKWPGKEIHLSEIARELRIGMSRVSQGKRVVCMDARNFPLADSSSRRGYIATRNMPSELTADWEKIPAAGWARMKLDMKMACTGCNRPMLPGETIIKAVLMHPSKNHPGKTYDTKPRLGYCCAPRVGVQL